MARISKPALNTISVCGDGKELARQCVPGIFSVNSQESILHYGELLSMKMSVYPLITVNGDELTEL